MSGIHLEKLAKSYKTISTISLRIDIFAQQALQQIVLETANYPIKPIQIRFQHGLCSNSKIG